MAEEVQELAKGARNEVASRTELAELVRHQGHCCALSGVRLSPPTAALDHKVAVASGGDHSIGNLQVVHEAINRMKGTLANDEFIEWCRTVADHSRSGAPYATGPGKNLNN